jgi:hypothetical protein
VLLTEAFGNSKSPATACVIVRFRKGLEFKDIDETGDALAKGAHDLGCDDFEDANDDDERDDYDPKGYSEEEGNDAEREKEEGFHGRSDGGKMKAERGLVPAPLGRFRWCGW